MAPSIKKQCNNYYVLEKKILLGEQRNFTLTKIIESSELLAIQL